MGKWKELDQWQSEFGYELGTRLWHEMRLTKKERRHERRMAFWKNLASTLGLAKFFI